MNRYIGFTYSAALSLFVLGAVATAAHNGGHILNSVKGNNQCKIVGQGFGFSIENNQLGQCPSEIYDSRGEDDCEKFKSEVLDTVIEQLNQTMKDCDLSKMFANSFSLAADFTIVWFEEDFNNSGPRTSAMAFVSDEDHNMGPEGIAETRAQLKSYQPFVNYDNDIRALLEGAIHTQADYLRKHPWCNYFKPPKGSEITFGEVKLNDTVIPEPSDLVYECKFQLNTLNSFLGLASDYYDATGSISFVDSEWIEAVEKIYEVMTLQQTPPPGGPNEGPIGLSFFSFERQTSRGSDTMPVKDGYPNPSKYNNNLIRSAFRPSGDACVFQFHIPSNAQAAVELKRISELVAQVNGQQELAQKLLQLGQTVEAAVWEHGTFEHPVYGDVFAYEVDGYGSRYFMDDFDVPNLLTLPVIGFVDLDNEVYQNTRDMILSSEGNPFFNSGGRYNGTSNPRLGPFYGSIRTQFAKIRTTDDDQEILDALKTIMKSNCGYGTIVEASKTIDDRDSSPCTNSFYPIGDSEFAQMILDLVERKPHLILKSDEQNVNLRSFLAINKGNTTSHL